MSVIIRTAVLVAWQEGDTAFELLHFFRKQGYQIFLFFHISGTLIIKYIYINYIPRNIFHTVICILFNLTYRVIFIELLRSSSCSACEQKLKSIQNV